MNGMTDKNPEKLSASKSTLTLKRSAVEQGVVRQSFSHGRTKAVVVEKVKRRIGPGEAKAPEPAPAAAPAAPKRPAGKPAPATHSPAQPASAPAVPPKASGVVLRTLTDEERNARAHAL